MNSAAVKAITSAPESTLNESSASAVASPTAKCLMSPWVLMGATCLLLATSGGIRFWRESQFETIARENEKCPFALNEFPKILGTWHMDEGANPKLDPHRSNSGSKCLSAPKLCRSRERRGRAGVDLVRHGARSLAIVPRFVIRPMAIN